MTSGPPPVLEKTEQILGEFAALARHTQAAVAFTDPGRNVLWINDSFVRLYGYAPEEIIGKRITLLLGKESSREVADSIKASIRAGLRITEKILHYDKQGNPVWVEVEIIPRTVDCGAAIGFLCLHRPIRELIDTQRSLAQEQRRTAQILAAASKISIIGTNPDGLITLFSEGARNLLGYESGELEGVHTPEIVHLESETLQRGRELSLELGREIRGFEVFVANAVRFGSETREWTYVRKDGSHFPVSLVVTALKGNDGEITGFIGVAQDLTELTEAEKARRKSEKILNAAGNLAGVGGWELDLATMELTWTKQTRCIHEVPEDYKPTLEGAINFYAPEARPIIERAVKDSMENGTSWEVLVPFISATGRKLWVRAQGSAEFQDGRVVRLFGAFQDFTKEHEIELNLKEAISKADESSRAKSVFIAHMGHEIRIPLIEIVEMIKGLEQQSDDERGKKRLQMISARGETIISRLNDILYFSKK